MDRLADLHIHTYLSDGTFSPEKVVEYSASKGLDAIAITDHDTCAAIEPAIEASKNFGLEIVPGVELAAELEGAEIHILGYLIDWQNMLFLNKLREIADARRNRAKEILKRLREKNVVISEEELFDFSGQGTVGRLHIAHLLLRKGFVFSIPEAFSRYIGDKAPCYVKKSRLLPEEVVGMIKDAVGVAVLAHPKTIKLKHKSIEDIVKLLVEKGIEGIEVYHSDQTKHDEKRLRNIADRYGLLVTGGSDCHGHGKKEILIGRVRVPYELIVKMKEFNKKRHE